MDVLAVLKRLFAHKLLLVLALVVAAAGTIAVNYRVSSDGVEERERPYGVAGVQLLVDTRPSSLTTLTDQPTEQLASRAKIYANFAKSAVVQPQLERNLADFPYPYGVYSRTGGADADPLGQAAAGTTSLTFSADGSTPLIQVSTQAPTPAAAVRLADAGGRALSQALATLRRQNDPKPQPATAPAATDPAGTAPAGADPAAADPATDPAATDPAATDPAATDPGGTDPTAADPAPADPAATDPAATDPAATDPAATAQPTAADAEPVVTIGVRKLGAATGGEVVPAKGKGTVVAIGLVFFAALCLLILLWDRFRLGRAERRRASAEAAAAATLAEPGQRGLELEAPGAGRSG